MVLNCIYVGAKVYGGIMLGYSILLLRSAILDMVTYPACNYASLLPFRILIIIITILLLLLLLSNLLYGTSTFSC